MTHLKDPPKAAGFWEAMASMWPIVLGALFILLGLGGFVLAVFAPASASDASLDSLRVMSGFLAAGGGMLIFFFI